jgi:hypothetical protein
LQGNHPSDDEGNAAEVGNDGAAGNTRDDAVADGFGGHGCTLKSRPQSVNSNAVMGASSRG